MGIYARTNFNIVCDSKETAEKVLKVLEDKKEDEQGNTFGQDLQVSDNEVFGAEDSGRVQNLEWRCEEIWNAIKDIKGVIEFSAPFMVEGDGMYFSNDNEQDHG